MNLIKLKKQTISFLVLMFTALNTMAQDKSYNFSIQEAVVFALENNVDVSQAIIDQRIADAQIAEIKGGALPQVSISGGFTDNFSLAEQQLPAEIVGGEPGTTIGVAFGNRYLFNGGLNVTQELLNFKLFQSVKSADALKELRTLNTLQTKEDLVLNVVQLYIQVKLSEKQVELLTQNLDRATNLVTLAQERLDNGIIKKLDVNQLIVNKNNLTTQVEDAKYSKNEQLRQLKLYLNLPVDTNVILTENLENETPYTLQNNLDTEANVTYQQLNQQLDLAIIDEKLVKAEYLPKLNAFFNYNYQGQTNEFQFSGDAFNQQWNGTWGLSASLTVFDGLARRKRLQQKQMETEKLEQEKTFLVKSIETNYANAVEQKNVNQEQIINQKTNMQLADEVYTGTQLSYGEGVANLTELLDTEFALRQAQSNYLNAILQFKIAELKLLKASGQLANLLKNN